MSTIHKIPSPSQVEYVNLPDFTGKHIDDGKLEVLECLCAGAYGHIYKALEKGSPGQKPIYYAVKCMKRPTRGSPEDKQQLHMLNLHRKVSDHPGVVKIHRIFRSPRYTFLVMDDCEGGDLTEAIAQGVFNLNDPLAKDVLLQVIDALHFCHSNNVFHGDLTPDNILCSTDGHVYLSDFRNAMDSSWSIVPVGRSGYMSPECIALSKSSTKKPYSTRANDIWSLGITLVAIITGQLPWYDAAKDDECYATYVKKGEKFFPVHLSISATASRVLARILAVDPSKRITLPDLKVALTDVDAFSSVTEQELMFTGPRDNLSAREAFSIYSTSRLSLISGSLDSSIELGLVCTCGKDCTSKANLNQGEKGSGISGGDLPCSPSGLSLRRRWLSKLTERFRKRA